jgi:hypothetical protein
MSNKSILGLVLAAVFATSMAAAELSHQQTYTACNAQGYDFAVGSATWTGTAFSTKVDHTFDFDVSVSGTQSAAHYQTSKRVKAIIVSDENGDRTVTPSSGSGDLSGSGITDIVFCVTNTKDAKENFDATSHPNQNGGTQDNPVNTESIQYEVPEFSAGLGLLTAAACLGLIVFRKH